MVDMRKRAVLARIVLLLGVVILSFAAYSRIMAGPEPQYPEGVPRDVPLLKPAEGATDVPKISTNDSAFLIPCDEGVRIHALFEERKSVDGLWRGWAPMLQITGPYSKLFSGDTGQETWDTRLPDRVQGIEPYITVTFLVGKEYVHKWIEATASVEIVYPLRIGGSSLYCPGPLRAGGCFMDKEEHLSRDLRFFVLSADESRAVGQYVKWHDNRGNEQPLFIASILFISIGLVAVFRGRLRKRHGDYVIHAQRAS